MSATNYQGFSIGFRRFRPRSRGPYPGTLNPKPFAVLIPEPNIRGGLKSRLAAEQDRRSTAAGSQELLMEPRGRRGGFWGLVPMGLGLIGFRFRV